jgi:hypothetical protein
MRKLSVAAFVRMRSIYFDVNAPDGHHQLSPGADGKEISSFPNAAARFRALFGKTPAK